MSPPPSIRPVSAHITRSLVAVLGLGAALAVLAAVVHWLVRDPLVREDFGPGVAVVGRPGLDRLLIRDGEGRWRTTSTADEPRLPDARLPARIRGRPALDAGGVVHALLPDAVVRREGGREVGRLPLPEAGGPDVLWRLAGVDGHDEPVLASRSGSGSRLHVRAAGAWLELTTDEAAAQPRFEDPIVLSEVRRAAGFRGPDGWEVWLWDEGRPVRWVAPGCHGPSAVFTPDGEALVVDGRTEGLFRLELSDGRLRFMADGNLGFLRRVPFSAGFRGDPVLLVAAFEDVQGWLQIHQTHLKGGGRYGLTTGFTHHYLPTLSADRRHLAYAQADFDRDGDDAFEETLYLFDFEDPSRTIRLGHRRGGPDDRGPFFAGAGATVVWVEAGRVLGATPRDASPSGP